MADWIRLFLEAKRALGRKYTTDDLTLRLLDRFLVDRGIKSPAEVSADVIDDFLASRVRTGPRSYNGLLGVIRRLFAWLVAQRLIATTPVRARSRREVQGRLPYIFNASQARRLLDAASRLPDHQRAKLRGATFHTLFALLYGLGLRVGEGAHLLTDDIDLERNLLTIRAAKFGKTRLVPFGPKMAALLRAFLDARFGSVVAPPKSALFSFHRAGKSISPQTVRNVFRAHLLPQLDVKCPAGTTSPRVHDLRHSFAVGTLLRWYRSGDAPSTRLEHLSIFLGHRNPKATAVYLTISSELLEQANDRFERFARPTLRAKEPL